MEQVVNKTLSRSQAGLKAKRYGEYFEALFKSACLARRIAVTRIPDGCKQLGQNRIIRVRSPFDWIVSKNGTTALIDTKTQEGKAFPNSKIDSHQVSELLPHETNGSIAGYVVWLREIDQIIFIPSTVLIKAQRDRGSIDGSTAGVMGIGSSNCLDASKLFGQDKAKLSTIELRTDQNGPG